MQRRRYFLPVVFLCHFFIATPVTASNMLPPNDLSKIYEKLSTIDKRLARDEFETKQEHAARVKKELDELEPIEFEIKVPDSRFTYDAEKKTYIYREYIDKSYSSDIPSGIKYNIINRKDDLGSYVGENAFGVKKNIDVTNETSYSLHIMVDLNKNKYIKKDDTLYYIVFSFKCDPEIAKKLKDNIELIAKVKVSPHKYTHGKDLYADLTKKNMYISDPTISNPSLNKKTTYYVYVDPIYFYVKNKNTGEVIETFKIK